MTPAALARLVFPAFRFGESSLDEALRLVELGVGGFCFYGGSAEEVVEASRLLKAASRTPLLIAADYENGAGQAVRGATELPSNMAIGASGSEALARRKGEITALEAAALGVDWVFAPVVDLASRPGNPIVNVRAYGADPALTARLAEAYISGLNSQGALSCLKHFPGHGRAAADSHLSLPELDGNAADLEADLKPFAALARRADAVMAGHLLAPALDGTAPASLSKAALTGALRGRLGFHGLIVTDALNMKAVPAGGEAGVRAFLAGADALLYPEDPYALHAALARAANDGLVRATDVALAVSRQEALARKLSPFRAAPRPAGVLRCAEHLAFAAEAAPACLAWALPGREVSFRPGDIVGYLEPLTAAGNWRGEAFVSELTRLGARVEPYQPGCGMRLAAAVFPLPRAGSGSVNLSPEQKAALEAAVKGAGPSALVSFGSPFVFGLENSPTAGLCAFCALEDFQRAAARALMGQLKPGGVMPAAAGAAEERK